MRTGRGSTAQRPLPNSIGSVDPDALKIPARRAEYSLTENAHSPVPAEPAHLLYVFDSTERCCNLRCETHEALGTRETRITYCPSSLAQEIIAALRAWKADITLV